MSSSVLFHPAVVAWFERSFRAPTVDVIRCILECVASDFRFERRDDPDRKANQAGISGLFAGAARWRSHETSSSSSQKRRPLIMHGLGKSGG